MSILNLEARVTMFATNSHIFFESYDAKQHCISKISNVIIEMA